MSAPIDGFILHLGVDDADMRVAKRILPERVKLIDVSAFMQESGFRVPGGLISACIRLFADLFPFFDSYERIAYTDCDVLFNRDIGDLVGQKLNAPLLAAHDDYMYFRPSYRQMMSMRPGAPYFNSGVLVFDMKAVREQGLLELTRQAVAEKGQGDQGALNIAFEGKWQTMHPNWNLMSNGTSDYRFSQAFARHFTAGKPWGNQVGVELDALKVWRELAQDTPWGKPFQQKIPFERGVTKRFFRKFDPLTGLLATKDVQRRRARYDGKKMHEIYAQQADAHMLAAPFPERLGGFG